MLVTEAVIGRYQRLHGLGWISKTGLGNWEIVTVIVHVELLCERVDTVDNVDATVGIDVGGWGDLVAGQVVVADESLAGLVDVVAVWESRSTEEDSEGVSTVVRVVALTDFEGVVSQVVVDGVWEVLAGGKEAENLTIFVQELLLGLNLAAT